MSAVLYLFGSGGAFLLGAALVLAAFGLRLRTKNKMLDFLAAIVAQIGLVLVLFSAVPLPYLVYGLLLVSTALWLATEKSEREFWRRKRRWIRLALVASWIIALVLEIPYQFKPSVAVRRGETVHIIGDSITAGLGDRFPTWPKLLEDATPLAVRDYSRAAATTSQAHSQARQIPPRVDVVIVEIGGNDLLGGTSAAEFAAALETLLQDVTHRSDRVLMFELPLPPLSNEYGRIQRRLAAQYGVRLIPKRVLMRVFTAGDATSDSIHLTAAGHQILATEVQHILRVSQ